jgi:hypothetical protein
MTFDDAAGLKAPVAATDTRRARGRQGFEPLSRTLPQ